MAMSRMAMLLLISGSSASAEPRYVTAEEGMEIHRKTFAVTRPGSCAAAKDAQEIVVCGQVSRDYRVPYEPEPGARVAGEGSGAAALGCLRMCPQPVDVKKIAVTAVKVFRKIFDPDR
jgi:hypothetical protein